MTLWMMVLMPLFPLLLLYYGPHATDLLLMEPEDVLGHPGQVGAAAGQVDEAPRVDEEVWPAQH